MSPALVRRAPSGRPIERGRRGQRRARRAPGADRSRLSKSPILSIVLSTVAPSLRRLFASVVALLRKDGRDAVAPGGLDRGQDTRLVVDQRVMGGGIAARDVLKLFLLVDVDQHMAVERLPQAGAQDLARLKDGVAVRENDGQSPFAGMAHRVERMRIEAIGERIVQEPIGGAEDRAIVRDFRASGARARRDSPCIPARPTARP